MSSRFDYGFSDYTRQFAALATSANRLALEHAENTWGVQLNAFERNASATADFFGELVQPSLQTNPFTLLPKGMQVARENLQRLATAGQEIVGLQVKTGQAFGELAQKSFSEVSKTARAKAS